MKLINYENDGFLNLIDKFFGLENEPFLTKRNNLGSVNITENEKEYKMDFLVPGFDKSDIKIEVEKDYIKVHGKLENKNENYNRKEYYNESFERMFTLPENVDKENVGAKMNNGILTLTLNKKEEVKIEPKLIEIS